MPYHLRSYPQTFLLFAFADSLKSAFTSKEKWKTKTDSKKSYLKYRRTAYYLRQKGYLKINCSPNGQNFLQITEKGQLELLLLKAQLQKSEIWDGKWRLVLFDIPEDSSNKRDELRRLLLKNNFVKLQASIYISPYSLNREAIIYLKNTGLINYIRIGRLEELDDDADLIKQFKLTKPNK